MSKIKETVHDFIKDQGTIYRLLINGWSFGFTFYGTMRDYHDLEKSIICGVSVAVIVAIIHHVLFFERDDKQINN